MRKSVLPWLACAVIAVIVVPALAWGAPARDPQKANAAFKVGDNFYTDLAGSAPDDSSVTINPGEKVTFNYPGDEGSGPHNVVFDDAQPSSCTQTDGDPLDPNTTAPMPDHAIGPVWTGECTFAASGTYTFYCEAHGHAMTGEVVVTGTVTPTPTATATPTATPTATATPTGPRFTAKDVGANNYWQDASQSQVTDNSITITAGERVTFEYPTGTSIHNVTFPTAPTPSACIKTKPGPDADQVPPMPDSVAQGFPGWEGYCQFNTAGTYSFVCSVHPAMTGTVIVEPNTPPPPETTITGGPGGPTNATNASFTFNSSAAGATFECKLDTPGGAGTYAACTSPQAYTTTANGAYTFSVRSSFPAGNPDPTPATRSFTVDTGPPDTTINGGPTGTTNGTAPSFAFSATEAGSTFQCKLDTPAGAGTYAACTSPQAYTTTANGNYTFSVRATDAAGNVDPSPATRAFTVDTAAPDTTIDSGPTGTTSNASPSFGFSSSEAGSTFECKLDGPGATTGTYVSCTSPRAVGPLADGAYTFSVRATDAAGNLDATPATRQFTVETSAPDTNITSGPTGATNVASPSFAFTSTKPGSTFECKLDGPGATTGTYAACTSPRAYASLADGSYTFSVRATDSLGTPDASPATRSFTLDTAAPETTITGGANGPINVNSTTMTFNSSEAGSTFECRLDGPGATVGSYGPCTSPRILGSLADGAYTFLVRATDGAGNVDATAASRSFTVDTAAPDTAITGGPTGATNQTAPSFTFTSEAGATFECKLDTPAGAGTYAACTSPQAYTTTANGAYTFSVRARDAAGNVDGSPATRAFTVDTAAPDTTITGGPTGATNGTSPSFAFNSSEAGSTFECKLDTPAGAGTYAACTSPQAYTTTANGAYTFSVRATDGAGNVDATPATRAFTVDTAAPDTTIDSGPTGTTNNASPSFGFSSSEAGSTFECKLDGPGATTGTYASCTSPRAYGPLVDGAYTISVRATDAAGNVDASPATRTFTVDTAAPDTSINSGPSGVTNGASPSFTFSSTKAGSTFECKLDGPGATTGTYASCTSPRAYGPLADGAYTFSVRATDPTGTPDPSPATRSFTVDTAAPDTTIDSGPTGTTNNASPSFGFSSSEAGSTFECKLDGPGATTGTYVSCTSPRAVGPLADGSYTFSVRARDAAGNVDASPATRAFTVETAAPDTSITTGPTGPTSNASPSFAFSSTKPGSTFECRLDGPGAATGTYASCTSPRAYASLADGAYTFSVRATDSTGNPDATPATRSFTVDTAAPDTTITGGPSGTTTSTSQSFTFTSEAGATFECKLDTPAGAGTYATCTSPQAYTTTAGGSYTFSVRATDAAGNVDASPATRSFTVDTAVPDTTITGGPTGVTSNASPSFTFTASKPGATFECKLDGPGAATGTYASCTSPRAYASLADGAYTLSVRATDATGTDATPATRSFTVDTAAPDTTITGGPNGTTTSTSQSFTFTSEAGATFECKLDTPAGAGAFAACTSPQAYTTTTLGNYTFSVRARDAAGNVDASPATRAFTVEAVATPTPTATPTVTPTVTPTATPTATSVPGVITGTVPAVLALTFNGAANFGAFMPGVAADYQATIGALVTSTAGNATLTVADPSSVATGRLVNGTVALQSALQAKATNAAQTSSAFAPVTGSANPLTLLTYAAAIAGDAVTVTLKQSIAATEPLHSGGYSKTLTFTLSTTQP